jgi:hypothetical protein
LLHENTAVISLQNGIDNEEKLAATAGPERVAGGASYIFAQVTQPGVIEHTGGPAAIVVGEWSGMRSGRLGRFAGVCQPAGFKACWLIFVEYSDVPGPDGDGEAADGTLPGEDALAGEFMALVRNAASEGRGQLL